MSDIGRELLRLLTERRHEWVYNDEWITRENLAMRAYPASGEVSLIVDIEDSRKALSAEDVAALSPVVASLTDELRANNRANELRRVRAALGLPQEGN